MCILYIYVTYIVYTYGPSFDACVLVIINSCKFKFDPHHIILAVATESHTMVRPTSIRFSLFYNDTF